MSEPEDYPGRKTAVRNMAEFGGRLKRDAMARVGTGRLGPAFVPMGDDTKLAWISNVLSLIANPSYRPPLLEQLSAGGYTYAQNPDIVISIAKSTAADNLRATLRAEAESRDIALRMDEMPARDQHQEMLFVAANRFANALTVFHRDVWHIHEPASMDYSQRNLQALAVVKRTVYHPTQRARVAND